MKTEPNENWRRRGEVGSKIMPYKDLSLAGSDRSTTRWSPILVWGRETGRMSYEVLALERGPRSGLPVLSVATASPDTRSSWVQPTSLAFPFSPPPFYFSSPIPTVLSANCSIFVQLISPTRCRQFSHSLLAHFVPKGSSRMMMTVRGYAMVDTRIIKLIVLLHR